MSSSAARLYEEDFVRLTEEQSSALRNAVKAGTNLPLDWENLAEEVESLGRARVDGDDCSRSEIELLLNDSPSFKGDVASMIAEESSRVARLTSGVLRLPGEDVGNIAAPTYAEQQVLGYWFPGDPPAP